MIYVGQEESKVKHFDIISHYNGGDKLIPKKSDIERIKINNEIDVELIKKFVEKREETTEMLPIDILLKFKAFCFPTKLKNIEKFYMKLYKRSLDIIEYNMDMINYLKFMQEYIHLKCLLFDDIQSLCLGFIRKPKIYEKNRFLKINSKSYKKLKEIILFFKEKKELSEIDEKIYELLPDDVKKIIINNTF